MKYIIKIYTITIISFFILGCQDEVNPTPDDNEVFSPLESIIGIDSIFIKRQSIFGIGFSESVINFEYENGILVSKSRIDSIFYSYSEPIYRYIETDLFYENNRLLKVKNYGLNDYDQFFIALDSFEYDFGNKLTRKYSYKFNNQQSLDSWEYIALNIDSFIYNDNKIFEIFHFDDSVDNFISKTRFAYENGNVIADTLWKNFNDTLLYIDRVHSYDYDNYFNYKLLDQSEIGRPKTTNNEIYKSYFQFYSTEPSGFIQNLITYNEMGLPTTMLRYNATPPGGSTDSLSIKYKYE